MTEVPTRTLAPLGGLRALLSAARRSIERLDGLEQAALLTLPLLLLHAEKLWYVKVPVLGLALAALVLPLARKSPAVWFTLTCFLAAGLLDNWQAADNHKYLMTYWCLALFLAALRGGDEAQLASSARWLLGLTFLFATAWKLIAADFWSGGFFEYALMFDPRFSGKLEILGLVDPGFLELNEAGLRALMSYESVVTSVPVELAPRLGAIARFLTLWSIALEGAIAVAFLLPQNRWIGPRRDALLLLFVVSTYLIAPVVGFGWLLIALGYTQCERQRGAWRMAYLLTLILLQAFRMPWLPVSSVFGG